MPRSPLLRCLAVAALSWAAACRSHTPPGALIASTPPGARVSIDGRPAGFVTPCRIDVGDDERVRISLELEGFRPAALVLAPHRERWLVHWGYGHASPAVWRLPIFLPAGDLFLPLRVDGGHAPGRVHVRLRPAG